MKTSPGLDPDGIICRGVITAIESEAIKAGRVTPPIATRSSANDKQCRSTFIKRVMILAFRNTLSLSFRSNDVDIVGTGSGGFRTAFSWGVLAECSALDDGDGGGGSVRNRASGSQADGKSEREKDSGEAHRKGERVLVVSLIGTGGSEGTSGLQPPLYNKFIYPSRAPRKNSRKGELEMVLGPRQKE